MKHTEHCLKAKAAWEAWVAAHPNYCKLCGGIGETCYEDDPSPSGVSLSAGTMKFCDPCSCVEAGKCPVCGETGIYEDDELKRDTCDKCGWTSGLDDPPHYECSCDDRIYPDFPVHGTQTGRF